MTVDDSSSATRWQSALLSVQAKLHEGITNLNESALQIVLVVSDDAKLVGTLTDGDIRRALLRDFTLASPIEPLINRDPLVVPPELNRETVLQLMQVNRIHQLPIVDPGRRVIGLHLWDQLIAQPVRDNLMVIMAGGQGIRLRPQTETCPKPLLPVAGKPILEHIIERARAEGFSRFVIAIHYLGHMIEDYFGDGSRWNVEITYLKEDRPLGSAGAMALIDPRPALPFVVSNGDVLTDIRYGELLDFHSSHRANATMAVRLYEWQHPFGVVRTTGVDIVGFDEKPISRTHINAGVYAFEPGVIDSLIPGEPCDAPSLFRRVGDSGGRVIVYPMHEPWLDVGSAGDLERANRGT